MTAFEGTHRDETFAELELTGTRLRGAVFEGCTFTRCRFEDSQLDDCRFIDCRIEQGDWIGLRLPNTTLVDVHFEGGRAMAIDWADVRKLTLRVSFTGMKLDYSTFADLPLKRTVFTECSLIEADFGGADLTGARFADCDLSRARFHHANLTRADLRGSRGLVVDPKTCRFRDTKVEPDTALLVLRTLGLQAPDLEALVGWSDDD